MGAGHDHAPDGTATGRHRRRLVLVLVLTLSVVGIQVVGGLVSGSLALLADAGHMLTDATGVAIALIATMLAARPATNARTFGLQRAEILAALANAVLLGVLAVWVIASRGPEVERPTRGGQRPDARSSRSPARSRIWSACSSCAAHARRASTCAAPTWRSSAT